MRLIFDQAADMKPRERLRVVLERAFVIACEELEIDHYSETVCLALHGAGSKMPVYDSQAGGFTEMRLRKDKPIRMAVRVGSNSGMFFLAFLHELIHVRQLLTGDFRIEDSDPTGDDIRTVSVCFQGRAFPAKKLLRIKRWAPMLDPSECEAYDRQEWLYQRVCERLDPADAKFIGPLPRYHKPTLLRYNLARVTRACIYAGLYVAAFISETPRMVKTPKGRLMIAQHVLYVLSGVLAAMLIAEIIKAV